MSDRLRQLLLEALSNSPASAAELARWTSAPIEQVLRALDQLGRDGLVGISHWAQERSKSIYRRRRQ